MTAGCRRFPPDHRESGPISADQARVSAIDYSEAYYKFAYADLTAPVPLPRFRAAKITGAHVIERPVRAGRGYFVELVMSVAVEGEWRGGEVIVDNRVVAIIPHDSTDAAWVESDLRRILITIVPGSAAAPAGEPYKFVYEISGVDQHIPSPTAFLIDVEPDGTRVFSWPESPSPQVVGWIIRYMPKSDTTDLKDALKLKDGLITESPYSTTIPFAGNWSFALTAISAYLVVESEPIWIHAELTDPPPGSTLYRVCPSEMGFPNFISNSAYVDIDGALTAGSSYKWIDKVNNLKALNERTWSQWTGWASMDGTVTKDSVLYWFQI